MWTNDWFYWMSLPDNMKWTVFDEPWPDSEGELCVDDLTTYGGARRGGKSLAAEELVRKIKEGQIRLCEWEGLICYLNGYRKSKTEPTRPLKGRGA